MKYVLLTLLGLGILGVFIAVIVSSCSGLSNTAVTYPDGGVLCSKDPDCLEGQYCGFVPGYTAAVCRGEATGNQKNLP